MQLIGWDWLAVLASPFVGSFLAVVAIRDRIGVNPLAGRSRCDSCGRAIGPIDLVPVFSFALLGGRCRACGAVIDPLHLVMEVGALAIALTNKIVTSGGVFLAGCLLGWTLLLLAAIDRGTHRLPDFLTYPLILAGLAVGYIVDTPLFASHVIGAAVGFGVFSLLSLGYRALRGREGLGLGDAKLLAAAGAWLTWMALPTVVSLAALLALLPIVLQRATGRPFRADEHIAFGPALAAATWLVWLVGPLVPV